MRILLLNPASAYVLRVFRDISLPEIPLSLAHIAAVLEGDGHKVEIIDLNVISRLQEIVDQLKGKNFDLIGFASTTPIINSCYNTIRIMKNVYPDATIVLGGWHASALPVRTLEECKDIDFIVKGEGEETISELARALSTHEDLSTIKGIIYRTKEGIIIENEDRPLIKDLDALPFPSRHLLPLKKYKKIGFYTVGGYYKKDLGISSIFTSRGCANRCSFCADHVIYKETCRFRSPENVLAEIKEMVHKYDIRIILILDANFMLSPKRVRRICELILKEKIKIIWACLARVDSVTAGLLRLMKKAGCIRISYGVESGSPRMLKLMNKQVRIKQIKKAIALTKKVGINVYVFFVYGMPGETVEDMRCSRQLLMEVRPDFVTQSVVIPYPGTDVYEEVVENNLLKEQNWDKFSFFFNNILNLPNAKEIFRYQKKIQRDFYFNIPYIWSRIKKIRSIYHVNFYLHGLKDFIIFFFLIGDKR